MKPEIERLPGGVVVLDHANDIIFVNETLLGWLEEPRERVLGSTMEAFFTPASKMYFLGHVLPALSLHGRIDEVSLSVNTGSGITVPMLVSGSVLEKSVETKQLLMLPLRRRYIMEDQLISARKRAEEAIGVKDRALQEMTAMARRLGLQQEELIELNAKLEKMATRDPLTGLANRRVYEDSMETLLSLCRRTGRHFSLALADIDWFKRVNDHYGHEYGDQVLKEVGTYLSRGLRDVDILVRMGGEEFALIFPETGAEDAAKVADRKRKEIAQSVIGNGPLTISIGITQARPSDTYDSLYRRADQALYQAKNSGRNTVIVL